jgi:hypothetical protein
MNWIRIKLSSLALWTSQRVDRVYTVQFSPNGRYLAVGALMEPWRLQWSIKSQSDEQDVLPRFRGWTDLYLGLGEWCYLASWAAATSAALLTWKNHGSLFRNKATLDSKQSSGTQVGYWRLVQMLYRRWRGISKLNMLSIMAEIQTGLDNSFQIFGV